MTEKFQPVVTENTSRSDRIVAQIKGLMLEGMLKPGEKLPPERELAELLNVSRTSVREAVKTLSAMGLLEIRKGHGVFVGEVNLGSMISRVGDALIIKKDELDQLFEIRKVLETHAAQWAAERSSQEEAAYISSLVLEARIACENTADADEIAGYDKKFHNAVIEASHNTVLVMVSSSLLGALARMRAKTVKVPGRLAQSILDHGEIARAILAKDGKRASQAMYDHIESVERSLLETED